MEIHHFTHRHPLELHVKTHLTADCSICGNLISDDSVTYGCSNCVYFIHETCAKLPEKLQRFFHPCSLFLINDVYGGAFQCNICAKNRSGCFCYHCSNCQFDLDIDCARLLIFKSEVKEKEIQHHSHVHPLVLLGDMGKYDQVSCTICEKLCMNHSYGCNNCKFYIHKSCMDMLPQKISIYFHPCQLVSLTTPSFYCDVCDKKDSGLCFRCGKCYFHLCSKCYLSTTKRSAKGEHIKHPIHFHPLTPFKEIDHKASCSFCRKICLTLTYGCPEQECSFYLHKSCMEILPREIQLFFHPCSLIALSTPFYKCDACCEDYSGVFFRCLACRFKLCVECCIMLRRRTISVDHEEEWVKQFRSHHPLMLSENMGDHCEVSCGVCEEILSNSSFSECRFYFHEACIDMLPQKIDEHFFHSCPHPCSLVLVSTSSYQCRGCDKRSAGLTFCCGRCQFHLCIECALLPTVLMGAHEKIQHFLHEHPLVLSKKKVSDVCCNACGTPCLGSTYGCSRCKLFLHKSCAELPRKIKNFSHLSHPLILASVNLGERRRATTSDQNKFKRAKCRLCLKDCCDFAFCCNRCDLQLDVECALLKPTIEYPGHNHLLTVVDKIHDNLECKFCKTCCKDSPVFRCLECNFSLHLLCGPLPYTIKDKCHVDTLTLKDQYVEDDDEDEDDFYCDACERRRDPRLCVYYCALGCPMIVEVKCVMSEVLASLKGERKNVELKTVGRHISCKLLMGKNLTIEEQNEADKKASDSKYAQIEAVLSLDEILISLNSVERRQLDDIEAAMKREVEISTVLSLANKDDRDTVAYYSAESFERIMEGLDSTVLEQEIPDFIVEHNEFVWFQDYLVPRTLIPTFQDLLGKKEDICDGSVLSLRVKSLIFYFLCGVIESMRATRIMDLTDKKLGQWFACLKWVKYAGFKFQFISQHMKQLTHAHFVVQAKKYRDETPIQLQNEIKLINQEMEKLTKSLRTLEKKNEIHNGDVKSAIDMLLKQSRVSMRWKPAADGLL